MCKFYVNSPLFSRCLQGGGNHLQPLEVGEIFVISGWYENS